MSHFLFSLHWLGRPRKLAKARGEPHAHGTSNPEQDTLVFVPPQVLTKTNETGRHKLSRMIPVQMTCIYVINILFITSFDDYPRPTFWHFLQL